MTQARVDADLNETSWGQRGDIVVEIAASSLCAIGEFGGIT